MAVEYSSEPQLSGARVRGGVMQRSRMRMILIGTVVAAALVVAVVVIATGRNAPVKRVEVPSGCGLMATAPTYQHVIVIMEENASYASVIGAAAAPYITSLANACGLATDYHSVTHASLPNYLAVTGGIPLRGLGSYLNDCLPRGCPRVMTSSIFQQVVKWRAYEESMPSPCDRSGSGSYAPKHNPPLYFSGLGATCRTRDISLGTTSSSPLLRDLANNRTAPEYMLVTPNLCNDGHDCGIAGSEAWLVKWMPLLIASGAYKARDTAIFIVWDEGEGGSYRTGEHCVGSNDSSCHVPLIVVAPSVPRGVTVGGNYSHYSLLATTEWLLGQPHLSGVAQMTGFNL
jgi:phosphatidylinositol-3-phosphatase